jgi:ubiquinone/menaquinone biosynthesis C-methylase UbiE
MENRIIENLLDQIAQLKAENEALSGGGSGKPTAGEVGADQYDKKSAGYDVFRTDSPGWRELEPIIDKFDLKGKTVLDAGCGTGSFFKDLVSKGPAKLVAYDPSPGMVTKAQAKADALDTTTDIEVFVACDFDKFTENQFDCVVCLQVIQNLTADDPTAAAGARAGFLKGLHRIVKPGGLCVVTTRYRLQDGHSISSWGDLYWYSEVCPKAVGFMELAVPQSPHKEMEVAGFKDCTLTNSPDTMIQTAAYTDFTKNMMLNSAFRAGDSFFSRLDDAELKVLQDHVQKKLDDGTLEAYMAARHKLRGDPKMGQVGIVCGTK